MSRMCGCFERRLKQRGKKMNQLILLVLVYCYGTHQSGHNRHQVAEAIVIATNSSKTAIIPTNSTESNKTSQQFKATSNATNPHPSSVYVFRAYKNQLFGALNQPTQKPEKSRTVDGEKSMISFRTIEVNGTTEASPSSKSELLDSAESKRSISVAPRLISNSNLQTNHQVSADREPMVSEKLEVENKDNIISNDDKELEEEKLADKLSKNSEMKNRIKQMLSKLELERSTRLIMNKSKLSSRSKNFLNKHIKSKRKHHFRLPLQQNLLSENPASESSEFKTRQEKMKKNSLPFGEARELSSNELEGGDYKSKSSTSNKKLTESASQRHEKWLDPKLRGQDEWALASEFHASNEDEDEDESAMVAFKSSNLEDDYEQGEEDEERAAKRALKRRMKSARAGEQPAGGANKLPPKLKAKIIEQFLKSGGKPQNIALSDSTITTTSQSKTKTVTTVYRIVPTLEKQVSEEQLEQQAPEVQQQQHISIGPANSDKFLAELGAGAAVQKGKAPIAQALAGTFSADGKHKFEQQHNGNKSGKRRANKAGRRAGRKLKKIMVTRWEMPQSESLTGEMADGKPEQKLTDLLGELGRPSKLAEPASSELGEFYRDEQHMSLRDAFKPALNEGSKLEQLTERAFAQQKTPVDSRDAQMVAHFNVGGTKSLAKAKSVAKARVAESHDWQQQQQERMSAEQIEQQNESFGENTKAAEQKDARNDRASSSGDQGESKGERTKGRGAQLARDSAQQQQQQSENAPETGRRAPSRTGGRQRGDDSLEQLKRSLQVANRTEVGAAARAVQERANVAQSEPAIKPPSRRASSVSRPRPAAQSKPASSNSTSNPTSTSSTSTTRAPSTSSSSSPSLTTTTTTTTSTTTSSRPASVKHNIMMLIDFGLPREGQPTERVAGAGGGARLERLATRTTSQQQQQQQQQVDSSWSATDASSNQWRPLAALDDDRRRPSQPALQPRRGAREQPTVNVQIFNQPAASGELGPHERQLSLMPSAPVQLASQPLDEPAPSQRQHETELELESATSMAAWPPAPPVWAQRALPRPHSGQNSSWPMQSGRIGELANQQPPHLAHLEQRPAGQQPPLYSAPFFFASSTKPAPQTSFEQPPLLESAQSSQFMQRVIHELVSSPALSDDLDGELDGALMSTDVGAQNEPAAGEMHQLNGHLFQQGHFQQQIKLDDGQFGALLMPPPVGQQQQVAAARVSAH